MGNSNCDICGHDKKMCICGSRQVGGTHYVAPYQHWDWVADTKLGYLEGCATKYAIRWRSKGGVEDLDKAKSYVWKIKELFVERRYFNVSMFSYKPNECLDLTRKFIKSANVDFLEGQFCEEMISWQNEAHLALCIRTLDQLSETAVLGPPWGNGQGGGGSTSTGVN